MARHKGVHMKLIISTLIALTFSLTAKAAAVQTVATISGYEYGINEVALLSNHTLRLTNVDKEVTILPLTDAVADKLLGNAMFLGNIETVTNNKIIVCMMLKVPSLADLRVAAYDYDTEKYSSDLQLILTDSGCSIHHTVVPKEFYHQTAAESLRAQMVILALNSLTK